MATSKKTLHDSLRNRYFTKINELFTEKGEEVLVVGSNEIAMPCVDDEGNGEFIIVTVKVPTGTRDGEVYDGYSMAEDYKLKCQQKAEKKIESDKKKAEKIARDRKMREEKAKLKAEREGK